MINYIQDLDLHDI